MLTIAVDDLITDKAKVPEELVVMNLTVGLSLLLVVSVTEKGLLTLYADKVLHVPVFS